MSCSDKHPPLPLPRSDKVIYGGRALSPVVTDANVLVSFDECMRKTRLRYPWVEGFELLFKIPDRGVPENAAEFRELVDWVKSRVDAGDKVHCGCIGGHGRTGMFLAALVSLYGEKDAIRYVRARYCKKAVESAKQVEFLCAHYGVEPAAGSDEWRQDDEWFGTSVPVLVPRRRKKKETITPMRNVGSMWDRV